MSMILTKANPIAELLADNVRTYLSVKNAFDACDDEIKIAVVDMVAIYRDDKATPEEKQRAVDTIVEALFPGIGADILGEYQTVRSQKAALANSVEMTKQEEEFANRVQEMMTKRQLTQAQLAQMSGVGQSAISNMLNRQCRPQRRTIRRMAEALGVQPEQLWPNFVDE